MVDSLPLDELAETLTLALPLELVESLDADALPLLEPELEVPEDSLAESESDLRETMTPITTPTTASTSTTPITASFLRCMLALPTTKVASLDNEKAELLLGLGENGE